MAKLAAAILIILALPGPVLTAQLSVDLVSVPESLELPLAAGHNRILEVRVTGGARAVWLARSADADLRAALESGRDELWRINLSSRAVEQALVVGVHGDAAQDFRVFAADATGRVAQSLAVSYGIARRAPGTFRLVALDRERITLAAAVRGWGRPAWLEPADVEVLEVSARDAPQAMAGELRRGFAKVAPGSWELAVDDTLREAWREAGALQVNFASGGGSVVELRARPRGLDVSEPIVVTVKQRERELVPGSNDYLRLAIDDVTAGQTLVELRTVEGDVLLNRRSVADGGLERFEFNGREYVLSLDKMVNLLIGDDFAVFSIATEAPSGPRVADLLRWVADSPHRFVRNGTEHNGRTASSHLRTKYLIAGARVRTVDEFLEHIASGSSTTSLPYLVRFDDGSEQPLRDWLQARIASETRDESDKR